MSATVDVPPEVHPGDTFTVTVKGVGVEAGPSTSPPPARHATIAVTGAVASPGPVALGSLLVPAEWPITTDEYTVTGKPGDEIEVTVISASQLYGVLPSGYLLTCTPAGDTHLVTIPVVAPSG